MKENWGLWLPRLPAHWHILVPDLPGLGESDYDITANYGYEAQAQRLRDWLTDLSVDSLHLVGSSMGGAIAAILAQRLQPAPRSLVLLNSAGIPDPAAAGKPRQDAPDHDNFLLIPQDWQGVYRMFNSVGQSGPTVSGLAMTALIGPDLLDRKDALRHIFNNLLTDPHAPARYLKNLQSPLQVQWGDRDVITSPRCVDWLRTAVPGADFRVFKGVGHLPMLEAPGRSARALIEFVQQNNN